VLEFIIGRTVLCVLSWLVRRSSDCAISIDIAFTSGYALLLVTFAVVSLGSFLLSSR
jgi:hypothetical protein